MTPDDLETVVLGGPGRLHRDEVAALAGVPEPDARALWAAMGLAEVPAGERAFTQGDVQALRLAYALRDSGLVDVDTLLVLARTMGQAMSRLAETQVAVLRAVAGGRPERAPQATAQLVGEVLPVLERLVVQVWRRQFAAAAVRSVGTRGLQRLPVVAVGFVDLVDFTRTSRVMDAAVLERMLERFERTASLRVTRSGGRVVKTLGDAVLYVCDEAGPAAEVALDTVRAHAEDPQLPEVRAGLALGPVLLRVGDVFGSPVNLASRLAEQARPGTVLADAQAAQALAGDGAYTIARLHARPVRGYRFLRPYRLRRAAVRPPGRTPPPAPAG